MGPSSTSSSRGTPRRAWALPMVLSTLCSDARLLLCDSAAFVIVPSSHLAASSSPPARTLAPLTSLSAVTASTAERGGTTTASRLKRTSALMEWAKENGIKCAGVEVSSGDRNSGLGLFLTQSPKPADIVIQVPTKLTLSVESPKEYNAVMERELFPSDPKAYRNAPWWAALSVQLNYYDRVNPSNARAGGISIGPWIRSLPRKYDTPIHWSESSLSELQYRPTTEAVALQKRLWRAQYDALASASDVFASVVSYDDFVWGSETARSRAFSGAYSGSAFNPVPYATVSALVVAYVGLGIGSWEQAANGAAMVVCGSILKDFVLPKLLRVQKYVICPLIDMANHVGAGATGTVSFEYFSDGFSLSATDGPGTPLVGSEMFIQYGPRSNDQLLQYYGFVERDNVHDVYILPPIREWDIGALEKACGRMVRPGRLEKLDRAGLLGRGAVGDANSSPDPTSNAEVANDIRGVVLTRASGIDPAVIQAVRALISTDGEWEEAGEAIGNFAAQVSLDNERAARTVLRRAMEAELDGKATTIEEDENLLVALSGRSGGGVDAEEMLPVAFRLEKKKLLREAIQNMR
ncbi:hypothetical protein ACHAXA_007437 [Cyclostephanos tholiformis]|uniref:Rubisco LSMT substrate-binding domain-containing protein n=1 Tax=Cyclostephanos tholiformis TaxID=382380 RepID=A0ABD3SDH5_9STRA